MFRIPDWILGRGVCLLAVVILASFASVLRAQSVGVMSQQQLQALLEDSGKALKSLAARRNQSVPSELVGKQDQYGHTYKDDVQQSVLPPEVQTRLEAVKTSAAEDLRAGDLPGAQLTLTRLRAELTAEIERFKAIIDYWREVGQKPASGYVLRNGTFRASGVEPGPLSKEAEALEARFDQQIESRDFTEAMRVTRPQYLEASKRALPEEVRQTLMAVDAGALKELVSATPTRRCIPTKETSHDDVPAPRVRGFPPSSDYYPKKLLRTGSRGTPIVFVIVDARGCPERALITGPSGQPEMDAGAARMAVDGFYLPAEENATAIRAGLSIRVNFDPPP